MSRTIEQYISIRAELVDEYNTLTRKINDMKARQAELYKVLFQHNTDRISQSVKVDEYFVPKIVISEKDETHALISSLQDVVESKGYASVADLKSLVNLSVSLSDEEYGWTGVDEIFMKAILEGWEITFPPVQLVDALPVKNPFEGFPNEPKEKIVRKAPAKKAVAKKTAAKKTAAKKTAAKKVTQKGTGNVAVVDPTEPRAITLDTNLLEFLAKNPGSKLADIQKNLRMGGSRKALSKTQVTNIMRQAKRRGLIENRGGTGRSAAWHVVEKTDA